MRCKLPKLKEEEPNTEANSESTDSTFANSQKEESKEEPCNGPVKPEIVFFGEKLPEKFHWGWDRIRNKSFYYIGLEEPKPLFEDGGCDLMIVIGTALAVFPFSGTVSQAEKECPKVLINLNNTATEGYDFEDLANFPERLYLEGKCDDTIW